LCLGSVLGGSHSDTRRKMFYPNGGFRFVLSLAARTTRPVGFNDDLRLKSFEVGIKIHP
jgi:hypothetical protein